MNTLTVSRPDVDTLAETLCDAGDLLAQVVTAIGDAKTFAGTPRSGDFEARLHALVEDLAVEYGITVMPS